jgi:hypothetical protein
MSAIQTIRSISNWLYWQPHNPSGNKSMTRVEPKLLPEPNLHKLRDAAAKRKLRDSKKTNNQTSLNSNNPDEYWTPTTIVLPSSTTFTTPTQVKNHPSSSKGMKQRKKNDVEKYENENSPIKWGLPMVTSLFGMAAVRLHEVGTSTTIELKEHWGGPLALEIVNSSWLQYVLAAATWYMIGRVVVEFVANIGNGNRNR